MGSVCLEIQAFLGWLFHSVSFRSMVLRMVKSLLMAAMRATILGLPRPQQCDGDVITGRGIL